MSLTGRSLLALPLRDALDLLEFFMFEPFELALHEGRMTHEAYNDATTGLLAVLYPSAWAGTLVEMPDGTLRTAPSWWDEDEYDRGLAPPDGAGVTDPVEAQRAALAATWTDLRRSSNSET